MLGSLPVQGWLPPRPDVPVTQLLSVVLLAHDAQHW
jgi:hypothetical protein